MALLPWLSSLVLISSKSAYSVKNKAGFSVLCSPTNLVSPKSGKVIILLAEHDWQLSSQSKLPHFIMTTTSSANSVEPIRFEIIYPMKDEWTQGASSNASSSSCEPMNISIFGKAQHAPANDISHGAHLYLMPIVERILKLLCHTRIQNNSPNQLTEVSINKSRNPQTQQGKQKHFIWNLAFISTHMWEPPWLHDFSRDPHQTGFPWFSKSTFGYRLGRPVNV